MTFSWFWGVSGNLTNSHVLSQHECHVQCEINSKPSKHYFFINFEKLAHKQNCARAGSTWSCEFTKNKQNAGNIIIFCALESPLKMTQQHTYWKCHKMMTINCNCHKDTFEDCKKWPLQLSQTCFRMQKVITAIVTNCLNETNAKSDHCNCH